MTYKEKLISILKTDEEIKKDLEELKLGTICKVYYKDFEFGNKMQFIKKYKQKQKNYSSRYKGKRNKFTYKYVFLYKSEIIETTGYAEKTGNPLEERHLRMYLKQSYIPYRGSYIHISLDGYYTEYYGDDDYKQALWKIGNTKSFDMQSEEVYEKIFNFLNENKNEDNTNR